MAVKRRVGLARVEGGDARHGKAHLEAGNAVGLLDALDNNGELRPRADARQLLLEIDGVGQ